MSVQPKTALRNNRERDAGVLCLNFVASGNLSWEKVMHTKQKERNPSRTRAASENGLCVKKGKKGKKRKNLCISSENQRGYLTDLPIADFNRLDDTKDTKEFFLCAVCILLVLVSCPVLSPDRPRDTHRGAASPGDIHPVSPLPVLVTFTPCPLCQSQ